MAVSYCCVAFAIVGLATHVLLVAGCVRAGQDLTGRPPLFYPGALSPPIRPQLADGTVKSMRIDCGTATIDNVPATWNVGDYPGSEVARRDSTKMSIVKNSIAFNVVIYHSSKREAKDADDEIRMFLRTAVRDSKASLKRFRAKFPSLFSQFDAATQLTAGIPPDASDEPWEYRIVRCMTRRYFSSVPSKYHYSHSDVFIAIREAKIHSVAAIVFLRSPSEGVQPPITIHVWTPADSCPPLQLGQVALEIASRLKLKNEQ